MIRPRNCGARLFSGSSRASARGGQGIGDDRNTERLPDAAKILQIRSGLRGQTIGQVVRPLQWCDRLVLCARVRDRLFVADTALDRLRERINWGEQVRGPPCGSVDPCCCGEPSVIEGSRVGGLVLRPGDKVVLTGAMERGREEITAQAESTGIRVTAGVSKQTRILVAADPDSLSGKAKKARELGVPVVGERVFLRALDEMTALGA